MYLQWTERVLALAMIIHEDQAPNVSTYSPTHFLLTDTTVAPMATLPGRPNGSAGGSVLLKLLEQTLCLFSLCVASVLHRCALSRTIVRFSSPMRPDGRSMPSDTM